MKKIRRLKQSFFDAARGIRYVFRNEQNFRIQVLISVLVVIGMIVFPLRVWEEILLVMLMTMVLTMELLNTALEHFADLVKPRVHEYVSLIKDMMAGAVLITSLCAGVVGAIIFLPHFLKFFE